MNFIYNLWIDLKPSDQNGKESRGRYTS